MLAPEDGEALARLVRLAAMAEGFTLILADVESDIYQEAVVDALVTRAMEARWRRVRLRAGEEGVLDQCVRAQPDGRPVAVTGIHDAARDRDSLRRLMTGLNYSRPRWKRELPVTVVLFLDTEAHQALLEFAPDFARYRSATVRFVGSLEVAPQGEVFMPWLSPDDRRQRMAQLEAPASSFPHQELSYALRQVRRAWELALHRHALGESPRFEEALVLASKLRPDWRPTEGVALVQALELWGTQVSDIAPLAGLQQLQSLDLGRTQVSDIAPLAGLQQLQNLNLFNTQVSDIAPLAGLRQLKTVYLSDTPVTDIAPLAGLKQLQSLDLWDTQVSDIAPLAGLQQLQSLGLWDTQVSDIAPLAGLQQLQSLGLRGTQVSDIAPLAGLPNLTAVILPNGQGWNPQEGPPPPPYSWPPQ